MVSAQPRKQRLRAAEADWQQRHRRLAAHVDPALRKKHDWKLPRAIPLRKGDEVFIARGKFRGRKGKIIGVDTSKGTVTVEGIKIKKTDEKEVARPLHPSNLILVSLDETDPRRRDKMLRRRRRGQEAPEAAAGSQGLGACPEERVLDDEDVAGRARHHGV